MKNSRYDRKLRAEFMPEALEIVEKPASPLGHFTIWFIVVIVASAIVWACYFKVDEVITAHAVIIPKDGVQVVSPLYEGTITDILVEEGDSVCTDQPLVNLNTTVRDINVAGIDKQRERLEYQNRLINKMLSDGDIAETEQNSDYSDIYGLMLSMQSEYTSQNEKLTTQAEQYSKQVDVEQTKLNRLIAGKDALAEQYTELQSYQTDSTETQALDILKERQKTVKAELADYKKLYKKGAIAKYLLDEKQKEYDDITSQIDMQTIKVTQEDNDNAYKLSGINNEIELATKDIRTQEQVISQAKTAYEQCLQEQDNLEKEYRKKLSDLLVNNSAVLADLDSEQQIQQEYIANNTLCSPVNGTVQSVECTTIGGVATAAQPLVTIVPDDAELIVEAQVQNRDIGSVYIGQEVQLKVDAFSFQKYGMLHGTVTNISPTAVQTQYSGLVYKVKISLDKKEFDTDGRLMPVSSGMTGTAEIKLAERPVIEFFLEPIFEYFDDSLKVS